ncbi:MAG: DUF3725 domain-containing protein [Calditrichaeota bacterium]|nr:MAG: DUF3725 domain-containing protein [Calditrichota bacterium]
MVSCLRYRPDQELHFCHQCFKGNPRRQRPSSRTG